MYNVCFLTMDNGKRSLAYVRVQSLWTNEQKTAGHFKSIVVCGSAIPNTSKHRSATKLFA